MVAAHDGRRLAIAAADAAAAALGLHPGLPLARAQAMVPGLAVAAADPASDAALLARLAAWAHLVSPLTAADPPDNLWIEAAGCAHLHGGEAAMLRRLVGALACQGIAAIAAIADTPGAAYAVARHGAGSVRFVPPGGAPSALAALPVAALRLAPATVTGLARVGVERVGDLATLPRAPLARRFGAEVLHRLDQALGRVPEPISPMAPATALSEEARPLEPLLGAEAVAQAAAGLAERLCVALERAGQGASLLDLVLGRVDGGHAALRIGLARPSRDPAHLATLLRERLDREGDRLVPDPDRDAGPEAGIETLRLSVQRAAPLAWTQPVSLAGPGDDSLAPLIDRLANRLGEGKIWRDAPVQSDVPERSVHRLPPLDGAAAASWPGWPRPVRLLDPPQRIEALALLPEHAPAAFTWRRVRHRIRRADGPERIAGEWWRNRAEVLSTRDYWTVEDETGRRFWLYRDGDGENPATGNLQWFLHGVF